LNELNHMSNPSPLRTIAKPPDSGAGQGKRPATTQLRSKHALSRLSESGKSTDCTAGQGIGAVERHSAPESKQKSHDGTAGQGKFRTRTPTFLDGQGKNHQTAKLVRGFSDRKPTSIERGVPVGTKGLDRGAELSEFCVGSEPVRAIQGAIRV
jgi:hypothetical protein